MSVDYDPDVTVQAALIENSDHPCVVRRLDPADGTYDQCMKPATWAALFASTCCDKTAWIYLCDDCQGMTHLFCAEHNQMRVPRVTAAHI